MFDFCLSCEQKSCLNFSNPLFEILKPMQIFFVGEQKNLLKKISSFKTENTNPLYFLAPFSCFCDYD